METGKPLLIHIDIDSPLKLLNFYQVKGVSYDQKALESFYETAWSRALDFFARHNIKAAFFVVGDEIENNEVIKKIVLRAHQAGHEIENHTYSHPYGLATLTENAIIEEITRCSAIIKNTTGRAPVGFRSPGYSINTAIINILERLGFKYDSSGFWSIMNPILRNSHKLLFKNGLKNEGFGYVTHKLKQYPYAPDENNWLLTTKDRNFYELPLPRTEVFNLPFYHNFNLWAPGSYTNLISKTINKPFLVYLFHIIEFMDLTDNIPEALSVHPNLKKPVSQKIKLSEQILASLCSRYQLLKTSDLVDKRNYNLVYDK